MRKAGLTVDNLLEVDLVTAEGKRLRVDADTDPELFWGLRGGGGNFGIATSLTYRLHHVGPLVLGGPMFWPLADAPEILDHIRSMAPDAPDDLGITITARNAPPAPFLPTEWYGKPVIGLVLVWTGDMAQGQRLIEPLRKMGTLLADAVRPVPYVAIQSMLDGGAPHGMHYYWKSHRLPKLSDDVIDVMMSGVDTLTSPFSQFSGWAMGGAASRVSADATAVGEREVGFELNVTAAWRPGPGDAHIAWVREQWEALRPHSVGVYANFLSDEDAAGVAAAYGSRLARLTALKDRYDPTNFFCHNANVRPSGGA